MNKEGLSERVAYRIVSYRVSAPVWIVLYLNILICAMSANASYLEGTLTLGDFVPFGGRFWTLLLLVASLVSVHGLLSKCPRTVSAGSIAGYLAWFMGLISWMFVYQGAENYLVPLLAIPMILFFMFIHLKYSIVARWEANFEEE